jgi:RNA polymerase sigma factor (sigma-70 family)
MPELIYKLNKTPKDVNKLLAQHKNLVYYMLTNMCQLTNQDAESAAWEALWDSIETFDVFAKSAFSTYACTLIRNAINNVLRKQQLEHTHQSAVIELCEQNNLVYTIEQDDAALVAFIDKVFEQYINRKTGLAKNILLVWFGTRFSMNVSNIAVACGCSPSYVTRVQDGFRAYLSGRLKEF